MNIFDYFFCTLSGIKNDCESDGATAYANLAQNGVSKTYFDKINKEADNLIACCNSFVNVNSEIQKITKSSENVPLDKLAVLIDFYRCYIGLNHPTSITTPEGVAVLILLCKMLKVGEIKSYTELSKVKETTLNMSDLVGIIEECSEEMGNKDTLIVSKILQRESPSFDKKYRRALYNLCKSIASVDGTIEPAEEEMLQEIARLDDEDSFNDVIVNTAKKDATQKKTLKDIM